jgi:hypothetical protein
MANPQFIDIDPYGIIATHPPRATLPVVAAPIPDDQKATNFNTFRPHLVAIGCMRLPNNGFAFDSSVISSNAESAFVRFAKMMQALKEQDDAKRFPPCTIFGHADPTGDDDYNKALSGRRALAVYAVLTRNIGIWEELFQTTVPGGGDQWGVQAIQQMLSTPLKSPPKDEFEPAYYTGPIDGAKTKETKQATDDAVAAYKLARDLSDINAVRKKLFEEYMDALCHDAKGERFVLDATTDFLAQGKGEKLGAKQALKGDVQGCSEFNPIFLLSKQMETDSNMSADMRQSRNDLYLPDRRVVVFIFRQGTVVDPASWPCPAAREGAGGCRQRFWSDGDKRRSESDKIRKFGENMTLITIGDSNNAVAAPVEQTGNTMACRFYHAFAYNSPCEAQSKEWVVRLMVGSRAEASRKGHPLKNCRYVVKAGESDSAAVIRGSTDDNGVVHIPVFDDKAKMTIRLDVARVSGPAPQPPAGGDKNPPDESKYVPLTLDGGALHAPDITDLLALAQRLYNMGFGGGDPAKWTGDDVAKALGLFQKMFFGSQTPSSLDDVKKAVITNHDIAGVAPPVSPDGTGSP